MYIRNIFQKKIANYTLCYNISLIIQAKKIAVIIPIEDWNDIKDKHPDVEVMEGDLPKWQKDQIDTRLKIIEDFPDRIHPIEELFAELNSEED